MLSKVLNLTDTELDQLADFMGYDIRVHRKFYRLPEGTLQLAKISKVLMALEQGRVSEFKGKNLDEINIDPNGRNTCHNFCSYTYYILPLFSSVKRNFFVQLYMVRGNMLFYTFLQRN